MPEITDIVAGTISAFCTQFVANPYLCYTEHGQHAYYYASLYASLPDRMRYCDINGHRVCRIQKEYPTATNLGRSKRQHWDIAVLKDSFNCPTPLHYDMSPLQCVVEFGMNEQLGHLTDDIDRLSHAKSNIDDAFAVHLYRFSYAGNPISRRDWSPQSHHIASLETIANTVAGTDVTLFFAVADVTGALQNGAWVIRNEVTERIA